MNKKSILMLLAMFLVCSGFSTNGTSKDSRAWDTTVPSYISITKNATSTQLQIDPIKISNTSNKKMFVEKITIVPINNWQIVNRNTNFNIMAFDSKKLSITYGNHDFINAYQEKITILPSTNYSLNLEGKMGGFNTSIVNQEIAKAVLTISYETVAVPPVAPTVEIINYQSEYDFNNDENIITSPFIVNATVGDGGTLSYKWEIDYWEGMIGQDYLAESDIFKTKTTNNITIEELNKYHFNNQYFYRTLQGKCTITNTKNGLQSSTSVDIYID